MTRAEIYRRAAQSIETGNARTLGYALDRAGQEQDMQREVEALFEAEKTEMGWFHDEQAIIVLCFAAAMAETGDL